MGGEEETDELGDDWERKDKDAEDLTASVSERQGQCTES